MTLAGSTTSTVTVNYATAAGSATTPSDFATAAGTLTFAPGILTQTITVPVVADSRYERNEAFSVMLSSPVNATITTATGTGTIQNDDGAPTLSINNVSQAEGNSGTSNFLFTVTLAGATDQTATVRYTTTDGTATAPGDYAATNGTLTFAPGTTTQPISVAVVGDVAVETHENFSLILSSLSGSASIHVEPAGNIPALSGWMLAAPAAMLASLTVVMLRR